MQHYPNSKPKIPKDNLIKFPLYLEIASGSYFFIYSLLLVIYSFLVFLLGSDIFLRIFCFFLFIVPVLLLIEMLLPVLGMRVQQCSTHQSSFGQQESKLIAKGPSHQFFEVLHWAVLCNDWKDGLFGHIYSRQVPGGKGCSIFHFFVLHCIILWAYIYCIYLCHHRV